MDTKELRILSLEFENALDSGPDDDDVIRIFKDQIDEIRFYTSIEDKPNDPYDVTTWLDMKTMQRTIDSHEKFMSILCEVAKDIPGLIMCQGQKGGDHLRFRANSQYSFHALWNDFTFQVRAHIERLMKHEEIFEEKNVAVTTEKKKEKKEMKDFSLTNLKNAVINKVTSLDKKTVTILAIIALLLLVFCKYNDIKDIFNGIKNKVKNSKNFKAMVADSQSAMNGLKKIVGIKAKEGSNE